MLNKILYNLIKLLIYLVKYFKLDRFFFDKIIFNIGLKQLIENKKYYNEFTCLQQADLKIFSQNGEDLILNRLLENKSNGFFVDVGAHHPVRFSNTYLSYLNGWNGINIDAMPNSMMIFDKIRPRDINIEVGLKTVIIGI